MPENIALASGFRVIGAQFVLPGTAAQDKHLVLLGITVGKTTPAKQTTRQSQDAVPVNILGGSGLAAQTALQEKSPALLLLTAHHVPLGNTQ